MLFSGEVYNRERSGFKIDFCGILKVILVEVELELLMDIYCN